jgi:hypothetical protein
MVASFFQRHELSTKTAETFREKGEDKKLHLNGPRGEELSTAGKLPDAEARERTPKNGCRALPRRNAQHSW